MTLNGKILKISSSTIHALTNSHVVAKCGENLLCTVQSGALCSS